MTIQAKVALDKERHPERYCPHKRCLWRTDGGYCPRHDGSHEEWSEYRDREEAREVVGGELW